MPEEGPQIKEESPIQTIEKPTTDGNITSVNPTPVQNSENRTGYIPDYRNTRMWEDRPDYQKYRGNFAQKLQNLKELFMTKRQLEKKADRERYEEDQKLNKLNNEDIGSI